jgi:hypothetical protein
MLPITAPLPPPAEVIVEKIELLPLDAEPAPPPIPDAPNAPTVTE